MTKNGKKLNVVLIESIPPSPPPPGLLLLFVYFCCRVYILIYFFRIKCSVALLSTVVTPVSDCTVYVML